MKVLDFRWSCKWHLPSYDWGKCFFIVSLCFIWTKSCRMTNYVCYLHIAFPWHGGHTWGTQQVWWPLHLLGSPSKGGRLSSRFWSMSWKSCQVGVKAEGGVCHPSKLLQLLEKYYSETEGPNSREGWSTFSRASTGSQRRSLAGQEWRTFMADWCKGSSYRGSR